LESFVVWSLLISLAALHLAYLFNYRIDSDEPQHLHVVWGWTQGMLPYRDLFDNHTPLFQFLCSPLMRVFGERADIVILMRLAMVPLFVASLAAIWKIASTLFSPRAGIWAVILAGLWPNFQLTSAEFRTDDLWLALWLWAVALAVQRPLTLQRAFGVGILFGTAFGVSMKTSLMLLAIVLALVTLAIIWRRMGETLDWRKIGRLTGVFLVGMSIVPSVIVLYFAAKGAWVPFYYCVVQHNALPGLGKWTRLGFHTIWAPCMAPVMYFAAQKVVRSHRVPELGMRRVFPVLAAGFLYFPMRSYWPLLTRQDFLPVTPLLCLGVAVGVITLLEPYWDRRGWPLGGVAFLSLFAAVEIAMSLSIQAPWVDKTTEWIQALATDLRLLAPTDLVMDAKGETIFRRRPYYWVMEGITKERFRQNLIVDDIPEMLTRTHTGAVTTVRMPLETKPFVWANYLPSSTRLFYLGKELGVVTPGQRLHFRITIPATYQLVCERGELEGVLDGKPYRGAQSIELEAGPHEFEVAAGEGRLAVAWAPALERGFKPFGTPWVPKNRARPGMPAREEP
jgi:hypothetical protein